MADVMQYVTFYSEGKMFGVDIRLVNEVNPNVAINPVPLSEPYIKGLLNVRGQVVLVVDVAVIFGREQRPLQENSHVIIFKTEQDFKRIHFNDTEIDVAAFGDKPIGLLVDMIGDVVTVGREDVESAPQHVDESISQFLDGVVKVDDRLLIILKPEKMLWYNKSKGQDV